MSQENVELYRRGIEAFNRRDLDAFLALAHADVVGVSRVLAIEGDSYRGHDGTREWWNDLLGVFPDFRIEVVRVRDAGDLTVSELQNSAHGEGSDAPDAPSRRPSRIVALRDPALSNPWKGTTDWERVEVPGRYEASEKTPRGAPAPP